MRFSNLFHLLNNRFAVSCMLFILLCGCNDDKPLSKVEIAPQAAELSAKARSFDVD